MAVKLLLCLTLCAVVNGLSKYPKIKNQKAPVEVLPKLNPELLPPWEEVLVDMQLTHRANQLAKLGVTETRNLLRLKKMDYQMMIFDWDDATAENDIKVMKEKAAELLEIATLKDDGKKPEEDERKKHRSGRLYFPGFVQSFEYISASFGQIPPVGAMPLVFAEPLDGCSPAGAATYSGMMVFVTRGECTFLEKATIAFAAGAKMLIIANTVDKIEAVATGIGIDKNVTAEMVKPLDVFSVVTTSNTSVAPLLWAAREMRRRDGNAVMSGSAIPLKCAKGGHCSPVLEEETRLQTEVQWGRMKVAIGGRQDDDSFDFLTSTYGGLLPADEPLRVVELTSLVSDKMMSLGCSPLPAAVDVGGAAVLVSRGGCRFDEKALHIQDLGATMVIVYDPEDRALQRLGGLHPTQGYIRIPAAMVSFSFVEAIRAAAGEDVTATFSPVAHGGGADKWIDVAYTEWAEGMEDQLLQIEGMIQKYGQSGDMPDIERWLRRRAHRLRNGSSDKSEL